MNFGERSKVMSCNTSSDFDLGTSDNCQLSTELADHLDRRRPDSWATKPSKVTLSTESEHGEVAESDSPQRVPPTVNQSTRELTWGNSSDESNLSPKNEPVKLWAVSELSTATGLLKTPPTSTTKSLWLTHSTKSSDEMPICNGSPNQSTNTENAKASPAPAKNPEVLAKDTDSPKPSVVLDMLPGNDETPSNSDERGKLLKKPCEIVKNFEIQHLFKNVSQYFMLFLKSI